MNSKSFPVEWNVNFDKAIKAKTTWEFDDELACHVYGYKNADCYYRHFSPINNLINIMVPYLGI